MNRPWETEPDELHFEIDGWKCHILRHAALKHLCGYLNIPEDHPWFGVSYDDFDAECHGGLTYSNMRDGLWWIGFDCAHCDDYLPGSRDPHFGEVYRTVEYVTNEIKALIPQAEAARVNPVFRRGSEAHTRQLEQQLAARA